MVSAVAKQNVNLMMSSDIEGMRRFANAESRGGNASMRNGKICVGVNFRFEPDTGKIVEFTNEGDTNLSQGVFRLEMPHNFLDMKTYTPNDLKKYPRIISVQCTPESQWGKQASALAEVVITESKTLYNELCENIEAKRIFKWPKSGEGRIR